jgi:hypothetical protein
MKATSVYTYRFCDSVAVAFLGCDGDTQYLTAKEARSLARALHAGARSIEREKFAQSNVPITTIPLTGGK